jgi:glycosyltransferase involved in cell wall biosynthesis
MANNLHITEYIALELGKGGSPDLSSVPVKSSSLVPGAHRATVSVLMATYAGERPERLARALESMFCQTAPPDELVLVVDGPVSAEQDEVIALYQHDKRINAMPVVRLAKNQGLGPALNSGLEQCRGDWIMRMDSDDESLIDRVEVQTEYLLRHPHVDVVGGWSEEFFDDSPATRIKSSPVSHDAIAQSLKIRNILAHPSLVIRTKVLRDVGGYRGTFPLLEDWDLYVRLMLAQARFAIIPKVLVRMLVGHDQTARRGGLRYVLCEVRFRTYLWTVGFVSTSQYAITTLAYAVFRTAGPALRNWLYRMVRT